MCYQSGFWMQSGVCGWERRGCRNSCREKLESNKELYLSHETHYVADMTEKKNAFSEILIKTSGEDCACKSYNQ